MAFFARNAAQRERIEPPALSRESSVTAASPENPSTSLANPDQWLLDWASAGTGYVGPAVNERSAMAVSAVFSCVNLLSAMLASVPLKIYRDDPKLGQVEAPDHKLYRMLGRMPFPGRPLTSHGWREGWGIHVYLWGNHYSVIRYDNAGRVIGFEPVPPNLGTVEIRRLSNGRNQYVVNWPAGLREVVDQDDMLHFAGPGFDGVRGVSRIQGFASRAISVAVTLEDQTGYVHENAAKPSGMVTTPAGISGQGAQRMEAAFNGRYAGRANAGKVIMADKDSVFTPFQISPEDLNTIEARKYSAEDICRFFRVPPVMAGVTGDATSWGTGIEQLMLGFMRFTMDSEFQRFEAEINAKLLSTSDHYAAFDRDALLAMDALASAQVAMTEINSGQLTPNEARAKKKRPSLGTVGDSALVNSTMITLDSAVNRPATPVPAPGASGAPPKNDAGSQIGLVW